MPSAFPGTEQSVARLLLLAGVSLFSTIAIASTAQAESPTISAPTQAGINEAIEILVSGPEKPGDIVRFADESGVLRKGAYTYVSNMKNQRTTLSAPAEPGSYLVVYVSEREVVASTPLTVVPVSADVRAPESASMSETIAVAFDGPRNAGDYLQFMTAEGEPIRALYAYAGTKGDAQANMKAPIEPGSYQIGYFTAKKLIGATPITVTASSASVTVQDAITANATLAVRFEGPLNSGDYLQFVAEDGQPMRGLYTYVTSKNAGEAKMKAPLEPGEYQIGYFTSKIMIGSAPITVSSVSAELSAPQTVAAGAHFEITWSGPNNSGDRIAIADAAGNANGDYTYPGNRTGPVTLRAPEVPGQHSIIYLTGRQIIGQTTFEVETVSATLAAPDAVPGREHFVVAWQGPGNVGDRINLNSDAEDELRGYRYVANDQGQETRLLAPAEAGGYTLQYVTHGGRVLTERAISVTPPAQQPGFLKVTADTRRPLSETDAIELVLDASGSMLQRIDGERRIDIAKRALASLVTDALPAGTPLALRVFGHKEADKCRSDLELPVAPLEQASTSARINGINAMNLAKTPIADSLQATSSDLAGVDGERIIVLVTDGEETCDGDPASVIASLRAGHKALRVNIIGFAIDDENLHDTFGQWATLGGGGYFQATQEAELATALLSSVSPAFSVRLPDGSLIEEGIAGEPALTLPPGSYQVYSAGREQNVTIAENTLSTIELTAAP